MFSAACRDVLAVEVFISTFSMDSEGEGGMEIGVLMVIIPLLSWEGGDSGVWMGESEAACRWLSNCK